MSVIGDPNSNRSPGDAEGGAHCELDGTLDRLARLTRRLFSVDMAVLACTDADDTWRAVDGTPPPADSRPWSIECPVRAADGRLLGGLRLLHGQARDFSDEDNQALQELACLAATAIEQHQALMRERADEDSWREEARKLSQAIAGSGTGVWDRNVVTGEITYSPGWKALLGYGESELTTSIDDAYTRLHPDDLGYVRAAMQDHFDGKTDSYEVEHRIRCKDGSYKWICSRGKVISRDTAGRALRMMGTTTDITDRKRAEFELRELAATDVLTTLPNRRHFMSRIAAELARIKGQGGLGSAVLMCDLDHFKHINDTWGHAIGDGVLQHFAILLRAQLRDTDLVGRIGGEEFAVVLPDTDIESAHLFARNVQRQIADTPYSSGGRDIPLTVSIGISSLHTKDDDAELALSRSDRALYYAKQRGRNRIESVFFR